MPNRGFFGFPKSPKAIERPSIPSCVLWLDATTLTELDGTKIATWKDISGTGHHAIQATSANQPFMRRAGNLAGVLFQYETSTYMTVGAALSGIQLFYCVYTYAHRGLTYSTLLGRTAPFSAYSKLNTAGTWGAYRTGEVGVGSYSPTDGLRMVAIDWPSASAVELSTNGLRLTVVVAGSDNTATDPSYVGWDGSASQYHNGCIFELIAGTVSQSLQKKLEIEAYLMKKWGIVPQI